jgi:4-hydroxy-2-oxoheptanedioate aldolase
MVELVNPARARLERGEVSLGVGLRQARTVDIAPAMKTAGFDWLFIDLEHNSMTLDQAVQISVAANAAGIAPIVRVPYGQYDMATRVLDGGAMGIVIPHVDTADEARVIADRLRYPPDGHRSVAGAMPQLAFAAVPMTEAASAMNKALLVAVMIETPLAVRNADAIAAVPGIDALLIGTSDLTMEMGISGQLDHPDVVKAYETILAACTKHKKIPAMGGVYNPPVMERYIRMGMRMILSGNDFAFMMESARARSTFLRGVKAS